MTTTALYKGDDVTEQKLSELTDSLQSTKDPAAIAKIVNSIRQLSETAAYMAGKDAGYRNGFQTAFRLG